jgi:hypothetical protein
VAVTSTLPAGVGGVAVGGRISATVGAAEVSIVGAGICTTDGSVGTAVGAEIGTPP